MKRFMVILAVSCMITGVLPVFAGGAREVPQIPPITTGTQYISPGTESPNQSATITFSVNIHVKSRDGYIPEYGLQIISPDGSIMKEIRETEKRDIGWFASLFRGYREFSLTRSISWDGMDPQGRVVPDGAYDVRLWVVDASGNREEVSVEDFVVDTRPPEARIVPPDPLLFNPNQSGRLDTLTITHTSATVEDVWEAEFIDSSGAPVRSYSWRDGVPGRAVWDGRDNRGEAASAGTYRYRVYSTDRAKNFAEFFLENIILDRTETPIAVVAESEYFSPPVSGSLVFYLDQAEQEGMVRWRARVTDPAGEHIYWRVEKEGAPPEELLFNGRGSDGTPLPEGKFVLTYEVEYFNGNIPEASESFIIDVTPPSVAVRSDYSLFDPSSGSSRPEVSISFEANEPVVWTGSIVDAQGNEIISADSNTCESPLIWDGTDFEGNPSDTGAYTVLGVFTDRAGNRTYFEPLALRLDSDPVELAVTTAEYFSPALQRLRIGIESTQRDEVESWAVLIKDGDGGEAARLTGSGTIPVSVEWDGRRAAEGKYTVSMEASFIKGTSFKSEADEFILDTTPPRVDTHISVTPFYKLEGRLLGQVDSFVSVEEENELGVWTVELADRAGRSLFRYEDTVDPSGRYYWDSALDDTVVLRAGESYRIRLTVTDAAGNRTVREHTVVPDTIAELKDGKLYLLTDHVIFGAYRHELDSVDAALIRRNRNAIDHAADILRRYPDYLIVLEAHALNIYLGTGLRERREEGILFPLTERRADTVRQELVDRGISPQRIRMEAFGGRTPLTDVRDRALWWVNRRVELILTEPRR